jgi:uncharacterized protein YukE
MLPTPDGGGSGGGDKKGMDPAKVQDVISRLGKAKADLAHAKQDADQAAHKLASAWHGPDSTRFQSQWKNDSNNIDQTVLDVTEMHKKLQGELAEQRAASN